MALMTTRPYVAMRWLVSLTARLAVSQDRLEELLAGPLGYQLGSMLLHLCCTSAAPLRRRGWCRCQPTNDLVSVGFAAPGCLPEPGQPGTPGLHVEAVAPDPGTRRSRPEGVGLCLSSWSKDWRHLAHLADASRRRSLYPSDRVCRRRQAGSPRRLLCAG